MRDLYRYRAGRREQATIVLFELPRLAPPGRSQRAGDTRDVALNDCVRTLNNRG